ncbi:MAG: hypothetical protein AAB677_02225 [Patescibacteria group bacterium]
MTTTYVVPDGTKRKPTAEEWATLLENRIPELIRRAREGNYDPTGLNLTMQKVVEGTMIDDGQTITVAEPKRKSVLRRIKSGLTIPATNGHGLLSEAKGTFPGWIDPNLTRYGCNVRGEARLETKVDVHELVENATFRQMFEGQGIDLGAFCLSQDQIEQFVLNNRDHLPQGCSTIFLFKVEDSFFVAPVYWSDDRRLKVGVYLFSYAYVWNADLHYRVVLPQLALKP